MDDNVIFSAGGFVVTTDMACGKSTSWRQKLTPHVRLSDVIATDVRTRNPWSQTERLVLGVLVYTLFLLAGAALATQLQTTFIWTQYLLAAIVGGWALKRELLTPRYQLIVAVSGQLHTLFETIDKAQAIYAEEALRAATGHQGTMLWQAQ